MIINTAVGVQRVPQDYMNVARVLNLSEWKVFTRILFPAVLPYMLTGIRLSMGVAWLGSASAQLPDLPSPPGTTGTLLEVDRLVHPLQAVLELRDRTSAHNTQRTEL